MKKLILALTASCIGLASASSFAEEAMNKEEMAQQKKMSATQAKHKKDKQHVKKHKEMAPKEMPKQEVAK